MRRPEFIARQAACPSGLLGRLIGIVMARETAATNAVALELLDLKSGDHVLEVGFGHGATVERIAAAASDGFVAGIDVSSEMCRMAERRNRRAVAEGRVELRVAPVEAIPYPDGRFDKVLTVNTIYFWADLPGPLREIVRVLKPGGRFVLTHRSDADFLRDFPASVYRFANDDDVRAALGAVGLTVVTLTHSAKGQASISHWLARR